MNSVIMELELPHCDRLEKKNLDSFVEFFILKNIYFRKQNLAEKFINSIVNVHIRLILFTFL